MHSSSLYLSALLPLPMCFQPEAATTTTTTAAAASSSVCAADWPFSPFAHTPAHHTLRSSLFLLSFVRSLLCSCVFDGVKPMVSGSFLASACLKVLCVLLLVRSHRHARIHNQPDGWTNRQTDGHSRWHTHAY